jgi:hypothetical protein
VKGRGSASRGHVAFASLITAAFLTAALASTAGAAVTLGQTGTPTLGCPGSNVSVQSAIGGPPGYTVPPGFGVITSWSFQGDPIPGSGKLLVWRPTGVASQFILLRKSATEAFSAGTVATYPVRFPVKPNDLLGMIANRPCTGPGPPGDLLEVKGFFMQPEPAEGSAVTMDGSANNVRLLIAAQVEADADHDDFGDDSQDKCLGTAGQFNGCPSTVTIDKLKQKGDTKVKVILTVPGAGTLEVGSPSDPALASAAAKTLKAKSKTLTENSKQQLKLTLKLTKSAIGKLEDAGALKLKVKAVYTPLGGPPGSQTKTKKLRS